MNIKPAMNTANEVEANISLIANRMLETIVKNMPERNEEEGRAKLESAIDAVLDIALDIEDEDLELCELAAPQQLYRDKRKQWEQDILDRNSPLLYLLADKACEIEDLVMSHIPQKGNTSSDCQYTAVMRALTELKMTFNGLEGEDFVPDRHFKPQDDYQGEYTE